MARALDRQYLAVAQTDKEYLRRCCGCRSGEEPCRGHVPGPGGWVAAASCLPRGCRAGLLPMCLVVRVPPGAARGAELCAQRGYPAVATHNPGVPPLRSPSLPPWALRSLGRGRGVLVVSPSPPQEAFHRGFRLQTLDASDRMNTPQARTGFV